MRIAVSILVVVAVVAGIVNLVVPTVAGDWNGLARVEDDSVAPAYEAGQVVVLREQASYDAGEVVLFPFEGGTAIGRVEDGTATTGYAIRAEDEPLPYPVRPTAEQILGTPDFALPGFASFVLSFVSGIPTPLFAIAFVVLIVLQSPGRLRRKHASLQQRPGTTLDRRAWVRARQALVGDDIDDVLDQEPVLGGTLDDVVVLDESVVVVDEPLEEDVYRAARGGRRSEPVDEVVVLHDDDTADVGAADVAPADEDAPAALDDAGSMGEGVAAVRDGDERTDEADRALEVADADDDVPAAVHADDVDADDAPAVAADDVDADDAPAVAADEVDADDAEWPVAARSTPTDARLSVDELEDVTAAAGLEAEAETVDGTAVAHVDDVDVAAGDLDADAADVGLVDDQAAVAGDDVGTDEHVVVAGEVLLAADEAARGVRMRARGDHEPQPWSVARHAGGPVDSLVELPRAHAGLVAATVLGLALAAGIYALQVWTATEEALPTVAGLEVAVGPARSGAVVAFVVLVSFAAYVIRYGFFRTPWSRYWTRYWPLMREVEEDVVVDLPHSLCDSIAPLVEVARRDEVPLLHQVFADGVHRWMVVDDGTLLEHVALPDGRIVGVDLDGERVVATAAADGGTNGHGGSLRRVGSLHELAREWLEGGQVGEISRELLPGGDTRISITRGDVTVVYEGPTDEPVASAAAGTGAGRDEA